MKNHFLLLDPPIKPIIENEGEERWTGDGVGEQGI